MTFIRVGLEKKNQLNTALIKREYVETGRIIPHHTNIQGLILQCN